MKTILLAEDEVTLSQVLADSLKRKGFSVEIAENGLEAIKLAQSMHFDLFILDVMMPKLSGWDVAEEIRKTDKNTPILFLTAKTEKEDVIKGYGLGGNDYLRKPFHFEELLFRINELLTRKTEAKTKETLSIGLYLFNPTRQELTFNNKTENLTHKESQLLIELITCKGTVLDRKRVLLELWGDDDFFSVRSMDAYISRLRKKLKNDPNVSILNIRGFGYKLVV
jgi:DNA-binding response OmpR family regulator